MMPNKNFFHLISRRRFKATKENVVPASSPVEDERRRLFLKALGAVGLGLLGVSVFPKKGQALVMGGAPATSVVGLKDSSNVRINPATEDTLSRLLRSTDLNFDQSGYLNVNIQEVSADGISSFSDSGGVSKKALVDADRHVQVDVLSSTLPTLASTESTLQMISFGGFKYTLRMVTVGNYDFVGEASIGSATSSAAWRIKRIDNTSGLVISWAGAGGFDQIWDNYLSLNYS